MIRIAIVEDEQIYVDTFRQYLEDFQRENHITLDVTVFRDGDEILAHYKPEFDIILMDIQMKFVDGMTAAEEIRNQDSRVIILFITNLAQYAIQGYKVGAFDYILKPISYFPFSQKLSAAIQKLSKRDAKYVILTLKDGVFRIDCAEINYIESDGHNLIYHTRQGNLIGSGTMKSAEEAFEHLHFSRANKGYLINLENVAGIKNKCALVHGEELPIARARYEQFMKDMTNYWSEE